MSKELFDSLTRYVCLWVPNWPLASLVVETPPDTPAVTIRSGKVSVATAAAKNCGVKCGMTRSLAQYHCPDVLIFSADKDRESAAFETVLEVFDRFAAGICVVRPGLAFAPAASAAKWVGGEEKLVERLIEEVAVNTGAECQVGIASGLSTSMLAARKSKIVQPEQTQYFLDPFPLKQLVSDLPRSQKQTSFQMLETLAALGVVDAKTFRNLGKPAILSRFGHMGEVVWKLASGEEPWVDVQKRATGKIEIVYELDPPAELVAHAATGIARASSELADKLQQSSMYSSTVNITLQSTGGVKHERTWTLLDATSSSQVARRITWQVRGWLESGGLRGEDTPASGGALQKLKLAALHPQTSPETDPLWGSVRTSRKVSQAVEQVQEILGEASVIRPKNHGGFDPRSRVSLTPWGLVPNESPPVEGAWEGCVEESPVVLFNDPPAALVIGKRENGTLGRIWVGRRGTLNGQPLKVFLSEDRTELPSGDHPVLSVQRLWVVRGRWWKKNDETHGPRCYLQVQRAQGPSLLLIQRKGNWYVEGIYGQRDGQSSRNPR